MSDQKAPKDKFRVFITTTEEGFGVDTIYTDEADEFTANQIVAQFSSAITKVQVFNDAGECIRWGGGVPAMLE